MKIKGKKPYKYCFVPGCGNNVTKTPNKIFLTVPMKHTRRKRWFEAVRRELPKSNSRFVCCEDHFNLEEDAENYMRFKLTGGKIFLKEDVVPHKFTCQPGRKLTGGTKVRMISVRRERRRMIEELIAERDRQQNGGGDAVVSACAETSGGYMFDNKDGAAVRVEGRDFRLNTDYCTTQQNLFEMVLLKCEPMIQDEEEIFTETSQDKNRIEVNVKEEVFEEETLPTIKEEPPDFDEIKPKLEVFYCEKCSEILPQANNFCINCH